MKFSLVFMAILAICAGHVIPVEDGVGMKTADKNFLMKQKFIFDVLHNLHLPMSKEYRSDMQGIVEEQEFYNNYEKVMKFFMMYRYGLLPRTEIFSVFNYRHVTELKGLFYLFYYSRDWNTFYRNVLWARQHINEGMFVYALYAAVIHRKDMQGIILPAHYEVLPYMYFNGLTIDEIMKYKTGDLHKLDKDIVILSKYTSDIAAMNDESKMAYFTEDIGWNMYYLLFNLDYPYWLGGKEFGLYKDRRGEQFLYMHQQLLARYYLERLSNGMGEIPELSWGTSIKTGYNPHMKYHNGLAFTVRKNYYEIYSTEGYNVLNPVSVLERRIRDVIDLGYIETTGGEKVDLNVDLLGNMIQSNPDSIDEKFFGKLIVYAHKMLGGGSWNDIVNYKVGPGAMEHFETTLRDPLFYRFYKKIVKFWFQYKNTLPKYKLEELMVPGVKIEKVDVGDLVTYFDMFDADVSTMMESDKTWMEHDKQYLGEDWMNKDYKDMYDNVDYDKNYYNRKMDEHVMGMGMMQKDYMLNYDETKYKNMKSTGYNRNWKWNDSMNNYKLKVRQWRLNHKPFTFTLDVTSNKPQTVVVRVYMGPKVNSMGKLLSINDNRENFVEIDQFLYDLKSGSNTIRRGSRDFYYSVKDRTMYSDLYKMVMLGLQGKFDFPLDMSEAHCGFPDRLLLPMGSASGMPMQFFFMITPYTNVKQYSTYKFWFSCGIGSGTRFIDDLPFGYPFDRFIDETYFYTPNMYFKDVMIYHMDDKDAFSDADKTHMLVNKADMETMYDYKYLGMMNKMDKVVDTPWKYKDFMIDDPSLYTDKMGMMKDYKYPQMMDSMKTMDRKWWMDKTNYKYPKMSMSGDYSKVGLVKDYKYPQMVDSMDDKVWTEKTDYKYPQMSMDGDYSKMDLVKGYKYPQMVDSMDDKVWAEKTDYKYPQMSMDGDYSKIDLVKGYKYPQMMDSIQHKLWTDKTDYKYPQMSMDGDYSKMDLVKGYKYPQMVDSIHHKLWTDKTDYNPHMNLDGDYSKVHLASDYKYPQFMDSMKVHLASDYKYPQFMDSMKPMDRKWWMDKTDYKYPQMSMDEDYSMKKMEMGSDFKYPQTKDSINKMNIDIDYKYPWMTTKTNTPWKYSDVMTNQRNMHMDKIDSEADYKYPSTVDGTKVPQYQFTMDSTTMSKYPWMRDTKKETEMPRRDSNRMIKSMLYF